MSAPRLKLDVNFVYSTKKLTTCPYNLHLFETYLNILLACNSASE